MRWGKRSSRTLAAVILAACTSARPTPAPSVLASPVTGCSPVRADTMVRSFVAAFNGGRIDELVSDAFVWVSFDAASKDVAYGHDAGLRYLHERQAAGDRLDLKTLQVGTEKSWDGAWGFGFAVTLTRAGRQYDGLGKGELYCDGAYPGISLWSMGSQ